jgi:cytosine/adenosine deaminase-related metal-dependent hydrolase
MPLSDAHGQFMIRTVHRAKYILAEPDLLLKNAAVHVSDPGRISRIEPWTNPPANLPVEVVDWGSAVIMPGFVNAHTHLELTFLHNQLTQFGSFTDWISQLIGRRRLRIREDFLASVKEGTRLSLASGATMIGDISASAVGVDAARGDRLRRVIFEETTAFLPDQAGEALSKLSALLDPPDASLLLEHGVSPHAPYSVSPELYRRTAELARRQGMLLATHVAETRAELQFLQTGDGEFIEFLRALGSLPMDWKPPGLPPVLYLDSLGVLGQNCVLIHCNYLDRESIARILKTRSSVVYCPRSHDFFGHEEHPVRQLLDFGINVALGTDSLASNTSLSMIDEMRYLYRKRKDLKSEEIFRAATLNGAAALNYGGSLGRLRRGYWADMTVFEVPQNLSSRQLPNQILEGAGECMATIVQGQIAWQRANPGSSGSGPICTE